MISPKVFVMMLLLTASVVAITVLHSQNAMASAYSGQTGGSTRSGMADLDLAESVEAENATMMTNQTINGNMSGVEFLSIQTAHSGSISQMNDTAYSLELDSVSDSTVLFSDRPNRIVKSVSTADFVGNWTTGADSFAADAPNDALIVEDTQTGNLETYVVESFDPVYDMNTNMLTYTIMTENNTSINLSSEFGQTILVIDATPDSETGASALCAGCGGRQCPPC